MSDLYAIVAANKAALAAMSPVDRALHDSDQRRSWVRGMTGREPPRDVLADEVRRLRAEHAAREAAAFQRGAEGRREIEKERDDLFNTIGRITEELDLPMDATAGRIIEAIRERVGAEREACASVALKVKVPAGAETWTPLEAWEEALLAANEAFRAAIRALPVPEDKA